jgi:hypothetical protein
VFRRAVSDRHIDGEIMRIRFSIRVLLASAGLVAIGCAALVRPSYFWSGLLCTFAIAVLVSALVAIAYRRGRSRAYWVGFAVFGWGHMLLALGPWLDNYTGEFILTRQLLDRLGYVIGHKVADLVEMPGIWHNLPYAANGGSSTYIYLTYLVSGQSIFTLLIAVAGGLIAQQIYVTRQLLDNN